MQDLAEVARK
jgi:hypothetical protein